MICKILSLFGNKLCADDNYSLHNRDNFTNKNNYLKNKKGFCQFFAAFLKSAEIVSIFN